MYHIYIYIYIYIDYYGIGRQAFPTGLQVLSSLPSNCHWALIIDITIIVFKLFESPSCDFDLYNDLEHDANRGYLFLPYRLLNFCFQGVFC